MKDWITPEMRNNLYILYKAKEKAEVMKANAFAETRAQLDELAQKAEGSHRQHIPACEDDALTGVALTKAIEEVIAEDDRQHMEGSDG